MDELAGRVKRVVGSILENESLTAGLDDPAAEVLLDWGIACAERIAVSTAGLDEDQAEEVMAPRLYATRRLMRQAARWVVNRVEMDSEAGAGFLSGIIEQAAVIYQDFALPEEDRRGEFLRRWSGLDDDPRRMISELRALIEGASSSTTTNTGGKDDKEQEIHHQAGHQAGRFTARAGPFESDAGHSSHRGVCDCRGLLSGDRF